MKITIIDDDVKKSTIYDIKNNIHIIENNEPIKYITTNTIQTVNITKTNQIFIIK
jgi:hypothetical protein